MWSSAERYRAVSLGGYPQAGTRPDSSRRDAFDYFAGVLAVLGLDVGDRLIELLAELLDAVADASQIGAEPDDLRGGPRRLLNLGLTRAAEPQLLSMERRSVGAVHRRGR